MRNLQKFFLVVVLNSVLFSNDLIEKVKHNLDAVETYTANMTIKVDISYVNMPKKEGKIFYKKPGKIKAEIDGLSMLPKQGLGLDYNEIISNPTNVYVPGGEEVIDSKPTQIIKVIPSDPESKIVLSSFWIDTTNNTVIQAEVTTKDNGTFLLKFIQTLVNKLAWLPKQVNINFTVPKFSIPQSFVSAKDKKRMDPEENPKSSKTKGTVEIIYSDYELNNNLPDSFFNEND
jgi:outer membrane lipoprotein-sorting protein